MAPIRLQRTTVRPGLWRVVSLLRRASAISCALAAGLAIITPVRATAPSYSVSVGGGSVSPNPICDGVPGTATLSGSLTIGNPNNEYSISNQSWSWSASVTAYAPNSTSTYGSLSGVTAPSVSISGSSSGTLTVTAGPSTSPGDYQISVTATDSFTQTDNTTHPATLTNQTPSGNTTVTVVNVTIGGVQYNDPTNGWTALPSELDAMVGTSVSLKALPTPSDASFPSSMPIWSGLASGSGTTATASYSGQSTSVGDETIKAHLGTATNGRTSTATVYKLVPRFDPAIWFTGRSVTSAGVGERAALDFSMVPAATSAPTTDWTYSGVGTLEDPGLSSGTDNNSGIYYAGVTAGSASFTLHILQGPSSGKSVPLSAVQIKTPTAGHEIRDNGRYNYHVAGDASAGFAGIISLLPSDVSFNSVEMAETNCAPSTANGDFAGETRGHMPDQIMGYMLWRNVSHDSVYGNVTVVGGSRVEDSVTVDVGPIPATTPPAWDGGTCIYNIPWSYRVDNPDGTYVTGTETGTALGNSPMAQTQSTTTSGGASATKDAGSDTTTLSSPVPPTNLGIIP